MKKSTINKAAGKNEFYTRERCYILETANDADDGNVSIARVRVLPGVTTAWHELDGIEERYLLVSGHGSMEVGDLPPTEVTVGDVIRIPANVRQRISNTGESDLIFYAICTPRFSPDCYIHLE